MRFRLLVFTTLFVLLGAAADAGEFRVDDVNSALEKAKEYENKIKPCVKNPKAQEAAQKAAERFYATEYQEKIQNEIKRLESENFKEVINEFKKGNTAEKATGLQPDERIYIFISSSIPVDTLRRYAVDLDRIHDGNVSMVMRGFVNGMKLFKPTMKFVRSINVKDVNCDPSVEKCETFNASINIDPLLFEKYGISSVPAIAYVKGVSLIDSTMSEGWGTNLEGSPEAYIVYGDVSLEYALKTIQDKTKNNLNSILKKLRNGFYQNQQGEDNADK